ncbi:alpha/beta hydrolase [Amnibacterium kyonggiense]|uniref:Alpha/beta hydrolase family protein n=1 Tax=Amnibacterium kyonggiense TaxID=595671 RepID=A0A4R7FL37_9MICO|nr:alpha/beta hydrolase [Amnibacterium kyonggiense]TDS77086.1 alpha/beta hydrolase family protein [Amnibacterium kyonggiense]
MRRPVVLVTGVVVLVVVLVAGVLTGLVITAKETARPSAAPSVEATWPTPAPIRWTDCTEASLRTAGAECAMVAVPLDWSAPRDGRTVRLAVSRVRHTASPSAGVMLTNPGGPGGSGLTLSTLGTKVPDGVGARYDWIGFDPRGVGSSRPRLSCDPGYANGPRPAYTPTSQASVDAWLERSEAYATACGEKNGALLEHDTTRDSANDMEYLRIALGVPRISYFGYSYGTYLGQVYATLYPSRVSRMVLDSTVDPSRVWYGANLDQDLAFQTTIERWFAWLASHDDVYRLGATQQAVQASYDRLSAKLRAQPDGRFGAAELTDTLVYAGYFQSLWSGLGDAFAQAATGDTAALQQYWRGLNETTDDNGYVGYLAVECTDAPWPGEWSVWAADAKRVDGRAPFETWANTWFNAPCRTWPAKAGVPVDVDGSKVAPILLIDETLDAATPFSGSLAVRKLFPKASLLAEPGGTSHADSLNGNSCVDDTIARYLEDGSLPARKAGDGPDATCAPLPVPSP